MLTRSQTQAITEWLSTLLGSDYRGADIQPSGAGCINATYQVGGAEPVFIKVGPVAHFDMYEKEALGLDALRRCEAVRVPAVLGEAALADCAVLALEFIPLSPVRAQHEARFGAALAALHGLQGSAFGLDHHNYIGRTHQINDWLPDWWAFFVEKRLLPQRKLAQLKGMRGALLQDLDTLIANVPNHFAAHQPSAALLHGDLWSGNMAVDEHGVPVLFDPAVYYGDPETDLAMTKLFGGPGPAFYDAYHAVMPPHPGQSQRQALYDLYHWLNHFNLFGVGYLGQVECCVSAVLREVR